MWKKIKLVLLRWWYKQWDTDRCVAHHRMYGKFYVRYPDGERSQNFSWRVANDYRDMFGGEVIEDF